MKIDFHSHILPGIDDGSRNVEESVALLDMMADDGVDIVVATPHFYCSENSIKKFIENRKNAYEKLKPFLKRTHPKIALGAEVLYDPALIRSSEISELCLQGTDYLLLEMPYTKLTPDIIKNVEELAGSSQIKLMIAHIERYLHFTAYDDLAKLMELDVIGQLNAKSFTKFSSRRMCKKLINDGFVYILGTDYHRTDSGHELLSAAEEVIINKFNEKMIGRIADNGQLILENAPIHKLKRL